MAEYRKGLNLTEIKEWVDKTPLPFVVHFRASSIGGKSLLLSHPFEVTESSDLSWQGEAEQLLVQNGTYSDYEMLMLAAGIENPDDKLPMSDSRAIAMILSKLEPDKQNLFLKKMSLAGRHGSCMTGQKFILIDAKTKQFKMAGDFTLEDGMYFSNTYWKYKQIINNTYNIPAKRYLLPAPKNDINKIGLTFEKFSPLLAGMDFMDKKKYFKSLKFQELLNGGKSIKWEPIKEETPSDSYCICRFCDTFLSASRVNTLRILGYTNWEMNCANCAVEFAEHIDFHGGEGQYCG